jgi:hypothetical protein
MGTQGIRRNTGNKIEKKKWLKQKSYKLNSSRIGNKIKKKK